jgi:O-acetyl-ADP-ribose deacetylase (regulator of RNase III)
MKVLVADITKLKVDAIVNASNATGPMGRGVAGAIAAAGGKKLTDDVWRICKSNSYKEGDCYISSSGELGKRGIQAIYHAVTMVYPGGRTSLDFVGKAMRATLDAAIQNGIKSIAFPGLGTGVGALNPKSVAIKMTTIAKAYEDKIDITICDIDEQFVSFVQEAMAFMPSRESNNERHTEQFGAGVE